MRVPKCLLMSAPLILFGCGSNSDDLTSPSPCNTISEAIPEVTVVQVAENPPESAGGSADDGLYVASAITEYTGIGGAVGLKQETHKVAMKVESQTYGLLYDSYRTAGTLEDRGDSLMATCPPPRGPSALSSYTALGDTILILDFQVVTLTRQQP